MNEAHVVEHLVPAVGVREVAEFLRRTTGQSNVRNVTTAFTNGQLADEATLPPTNPISIQKGGVPLDPEESVNLTFGVPAANFRYRSTFPEYMPIDLVGPRAGPVAAGGQRVTLCPIRPAGSRTAYSLGRTGRAQRPGDDAMIELYYWPTPNGKKISVMLEECELPYTVKPVDIGRGDQFEPDFLAISPNNRMPAIVDRDTGVSVFESGAILMYLAEKSGRFLPGEQAARYDVLQWLFWQMGGLGPMAGQLSHFVNYAPEDVPYAKERYGNEYDRLLGVMNTRLEDRSYLAGELSIADFASYPWVVAYKKLGADIDGFPALRRWIDDLKSRPALRRGMEVGSDWESDLTGDDARKLLFGQTSKSRKRKAG